MNTQWRKVLGDGREHRLQIGLIGLILTLGTAGVVATLDARAVLQREIAASYQLARSPDLVLWFDKVDDHLLDEVRTQPGVAAVDARRIASTRVAGKEGAWIPTRLLVLRDFGSQRVGLVHQHAGAWPAPAGGILIEQSSMPLLATALGEKLRIRTPGGGITSLPITGVVHDPAVAPSTQDRIIYAYVTPATAALLGQSPDLDQLTVLMEDRRSGVADMAGALRAALTKKNAPPLRIDNLPNTHPHAALMAMMLRVLGVMAAMAFTCSAALAAFAVSLWMKREVRQVGIMKTIGARFHQIAGQYLALVGPLVVIATALALPLGAFAGRGLVRYYETNLNIDVADWTAPSTWWFGELLGALGVPFLAMAGPILRAARMSAREAIHDPGITAQTAPRPLTAKLIKLPGRQWTLALRNTFRRPGRLALTLLGLATGGALFLTAENLYASLMRVVDLSLADQGHDLEVILPRAAPATRLEMLARRIPGVETAEAWRRTGVGLLTAADEEADSLSEPRRFALTGYPAGTQLLKLPAKQGRWPQPGETDAIVITRFVQTEVPGLKVGSEVVLKFRERRTKVHVAGVVEEIVTPMIYASFPAYEAIAGPGDASTDLRVKTSRPERVGPALDDALLDARIAVGQIQTRADLREVLAEHFYVVTTVGKMIALAAALVGAICLAAFASLNVLERAREIGVMRTLGATPGTVLAIFLAESGAIAGLSALLAVGLSLVATQALNDMTSRQLLQVAVPLVVSGPALGILVSGLLVVMLDVWLPVGRMLRMSVREALAYE